MPPQNIADTRLIPSACTLEPSQDISIEPQGNELFGVVRLWTPPTDHPAATAVIRGHKPLFGQFGNFIIFVRLHDVTINLLQVASQNALFRGHLPPSSMIRAKSRPDTGFMQ
jgi:hypothetical protein